MAPLDRPALAARLQTCHLAGRFRLRSGQIADHYFDKYLFESDPELLAAVAALATPLVPSNTELLAGLELGGIALSTALSLRTGLPQVLVRKEAKAHGTAKRIEGCDVAGLNTLAVEDVVTTGGQIVASAEALRLAGAIVETAFCVVDRRTQSSEPDILFAAGIALRSLFVATDLETH